MKIPESASWIPVRNASPADDQDAEHQSLSAAPNSMSARSGRNDRGPYLMDHRQLQVRIRIVHGMRAFSVRKTRGAIQHEKERGPLSSTPRRSHGHDPDRDDSPDTRTAAARPRGAPARTGPQRRPHGLRPSLKGRPRIERRQDQDEAGEAEADEEKEVSRETIRGRENRQPEEGHGHERDRQPRCRRELEETRGRGLKTAPLRRSRANPGRAEQARAGAPAKTP